MSDEDEKKDVNQVFLAITAPSTAPMMKLVVAFGTVNSFAQISSDILAEV